MSKRWLSRVGVAVVLLALPLSTTFIRPQGGAGHLSNGVLHISAPTWNFGTLSSGGSYAHKFEIFNHTDKAILLAGSSSSCGCTVPKLPDEPIEPGQSGFVDISLTPGERSGPYVGKVVVQTDHEAFRHFELTLSGNFEHFGGHLSVFPQQLFIEQVQGDAVKSERIMVGRDGYDQLSFESVSYERTEISIEEAKSWESPGHDSSRYTELEVRVSGDLPVGEISDIVTIHTKHATNSTVSVPIHIRILPAVEVYPPKVFVAVGQRGELRGEVRISHRLRDPIKIADTVLSSDLSGQVAFHQISLDSIELSYREMADRQGSSRSGWVEIRFANGNQERVTIPIVILDTE